MPGCGAMRMSISGIKPASFFGFIFLAGMFATKTIPPGMLKKAKAVVEQRQDMHGRNKNKK
jgi:hypothetical protein